jgi:hypothetical protein
MSHTYSPVLEYVRYLGFINWYACTYMARSKGGGFGPDDHDHICTRTGISNAHCIGKLAATSAVY